MRKADAVLIGIPATYFLIVGLLAPLQVTLTGALGVGSLVASAFVVHALFVDPPG